MRFLITCYFGGVCLLALGAAPAPAQMTGLSSASQSIASVGSPGGRPAPEQRILCGDMATLVAQVQGESRPRLPQSYQTEHFVIYYTTDSSSPHSPAPDDADRNGIPDYIEHLGSYFEQALAFYTAPSPGGMGYTGPPLHTGQRYPVCVYNLPTGFSGQTWPDSKAGRRATSHISIDAHLYEPYVRQVAAHELFHAVQYGYNYTASEWWREASADWAAHQVFPDVDTYIIPYYDWFLVPDWPLDYSDGWHEYGSSIWAEYLSETHGRDLIHAIWLDQRAENDSLKATAQALAAIGTTLAAQFHDFAAWNWFTGDRADGGHYKAGQSFPQIGTADHAADNVGPLSGSVQHLGSAYLALIPAAAATAALPRGPGTAAIASVSLQDPHRRPWWGKSGAPAPAPAAKPGSAIKAADVVSSSWARGLTIRLRAESGLDSQLILESTDGTRTVVTASAGRYHIAGFEKQYRRVVVVLTNGDTQVRHAFTGSIGLGVIYRDQYGYIWDLEIAPDGTVSGTVDVGDTQPWSVHGTIQEAGFKWRAINPVSQRGGNWSTGFDLSGSLINGAGTDVFWTNDAGRSGTWAGTQVDGPVPAAAPGTLRGPALR